MKLAVQVVIQYHSSKIKSIPQILAKADTNAQSSLTVSLLGKETDCVLQVEGVQGHWVLILGEWLVTKETHKLL